MRKFVRITAMIALLVSAAAPATAATPSEFYATLLRRGISAFEGQRYADAAKQLRIAAFGLVEAIDQYQVAQAYLALAYDKLKETDKARDAARRVVVAERVERRWSTVALPAAIRTAFDALAAKLLTPAEIAILRGAATAAPAPQMATTAATTKAPPPPAATTTTAVTPPRTQAAPPQTTTQAPQPAPTATTKPAPPPITVPAPVTTPPRTTTTTTTTTTRPATPPPAPQTVTATPPRTTAPAAAQPQRPATAQPQRTTQAGTNGRTTTPPQASAQTPRPAPAQVQPAAQTAPAPVARTFSPGEIATRLVAAERALNTANLLDARRVYRELLASANVPHETMIRVAEGLYRARDFAAALQGFNRAGTLRRGEEPYRYYIAVAAYETGDTARAKKELAAALPFIEMTPDVTRYRAKIEGAL